MAQETPTPPRKGIGDMTLKDILGVLGSGGGFAGYAALLLVLLSYSGCQLPNIDWKKPPILNPPRRADVPNAIGRLTMGNVGCTGTIIGPVDDDDTTVCILTAAHCINVGATGTMKLKDGRTLPFKCVSRNATADCAWLVAPRPAGEVPWAYLAKELPAKGDPVWHQGYGVHIPGNVEKGTFEGVTGDGSQCRFTLSVSSGDSGGGIVHTSDGAILSPVCCTTRLSGPGSVMGSTPMNAAAIRPGNLADAVDAESLMRPVIILPDPRWEEPPTG